jgi:hypothetical protein
MELEVIYDREDIIVSQSWMGCLLEHHAKMFLNVSRTILLYVALKAVKNWESSCKI